MVMNMTEINLVISPDQMSNDQFAKHMSLRHQDSLGGLKAIELPYRDTGLSHAWRAFHRRLHTLRLDLGHEHENCERKAG